MALARPALRLSTGPAGSRSRLGGPPVLPPGTPWPTWGERTLDFVGVIDFDELASTMWLPELPGTGTVAFYYATDPPRPWGDDPAQTDGWRVLPDAAVPAGPATRPEVPLAAHPFVSLPSPHEPVLGPLGAAVAAFGETYPELYASWERFIWGYEPRHQTGGWPIVVQRALWRDCAAAAGHALDSVAEPGPVQAADWRLLLQLDADDRLGWRWGEPGFVYFSARGADVRSGALDRSWLIVQATP
ncbi:MAG TPA: YwqG family protein [Streptosporangiaceae bacterium]|nr:YwqG family protein [Streptosporangiaceae bacterium]